MNQVAVYPGTFDPITNGHLAILERATKIFDTIILSVAKTARKDPFFSLDDRVAMAKEATADFGGVLVTACHGLLVDFMREKSATVILRGLRAISDFDYEFQLAGMNHRMSPGIETVFMPALGEQTYISSTMVREIVRLDGDPSIFVPQVVLDYLKR